MWREGGLGGTNGYEEWEGKERAEASGEIGKRKDGRPVCEVGGGVLESLG